MMKVKCAVCGKITAGRLPRASRHDVGDGSVMLPRRHGCNGDIEDGIIIDDTPMPPAVVRDQFWPRPYTSPRPVAADKETEHDGKEAISN